MPGTRHSGKSFYYKQFSYSFICPEPSGINLTNVRIFSKKAMEGQKEKGEKFPLFNSLQPFQVFTEQEPHENRNQECVYLLLIYS